MKYVFYFQQSSARKNELYLCIFEVFEVKKAKYIQKKFIAS